MKADEVSKQNIISILEAVASRGARYRSNRVLALVRSIYRWGIAEDLIHSTGMASLGVNPHTISLVLDHISVTKGTVTGAVYVKYVLGPLPLGPDRLHEANCEFLRHRRLLKLTKRTA